MHIWSGRCLGLVKEAHARERERVKKYVRSAGRLLDGERVLLADGEELVERTVDALEAEPVDQSIERFETRRRVLTAHPREGDPKGLSVQETMRTQVWGKGKLTRSIMVDKCRSAALSSSFA